MCLPRRSWARCEPVIGAEPRLRQQFGLALVEAYDKEIDDLLRRAAHDPQPGVRAAAVEAIGSAGWPSNPNTLSILDCAIRDDDGRVRAASVTAIAQAFPSHSGTFAVLRDASRDDDGHVRAAAVAAIARVFPDHPDTLTLLHDAVRDDDEYVRATAVRTLAQAFPTDPSTLPVLHRAIGDADAGVAGTAMRAIAWRLPDHADTSSMLHDLARHAPAQDYVRYEARDLITDLEQGHPPRPPTDAELDMYWDGRTYTEDDMPLYRWVPAPIRRVWHLPLAELRDRAAADPDPAVRAAAVERTATGWPDHPDTLPLLRDAAWGADERIRRAAIQGLGRLLSHRSDGQPRESGQAWSRPPSWTRWQ